MASDETRHDDKGGADAVDAASAWFENRALLRSVIESLPFDFFALDTEGRYILQNPTCIRRWGNNLGKRVEDIAPDAQTLELWSTNNRRALAGETVEAEVVLTVEGKKGYYLNIVRPIHEGERVVGVLGFNIDITSQKMGEQARIALEKKIHKAKRLESLGLLAGGIAHDFNNILQGILGNTSLALEEIPAGSPARARLQAIERASQHASDLARQILAFSGRGLLSLRAVDLSSLVADLEPILRSLCPPEVDIRLELCPDLPPILGDVTRLRQMLMNLVTNAREAMAAAPGKGGLIQISTRQGSCDRDSLDELQLGARLPGGVYVDLEVLDTGSGMERAIMEKIFEPFFSTKVAGRGLGLAVVSGVVRGHQAGCRVSSVPGQGTAFEVLFVPLLSQAGALDAGQAAVAARSTAGRSSALVLVIDDDDMMRNFTQHVLEWLGYQPITASGVEGVRFLKQNQEKILAVLLDADLQGRDVDQILDLLKQAQPGVPVIELSGLPGGKASERLGVFEPAGFLEKPFRVEQLHAILQKVLPTM